MQEKIFNSLTLKQFLTIDSREVKFKKELFEENVFELLLFVAMNECMLNSKSYYSFHMSF